MLRKSSYSSNKDTTLSNAIYHAYLLPFVAFSVPIYPYTMSEKMRNEKVDSASSAEHVEYVDAVKTVHADGHIDMVDTHAIGGELNEMPKGYYTSVSFIGTVIAVCTGSICAYLGWVLPANTLALINADIGPSENMGWVSTVWVLGSAIGFLLVGRLSDIFGRKWMVMGTTVLSLVGNIVGATAGSMETLIGANACNGIAAAGQLSFGIVLGELVPNKQRGPIVTLVFLSSLPFAVFGPIIARSFIDNTKQGWRWSYYLGIIFAGITLVLYQFLYHPPTYDQLHVHGKSKWQQFKELDFVGMFLFVAGCVLFLIGLSWGGQAYPWSSARVIATIVVGIVTLIAFGLYEQYIFKGQPLMPPRLFKNIGYVAICAIACIGAMVYYSMTVIWPTLISTVYTTSVKEVGWQSSVVGGGILLGQVFGGFAISYLPKVKWQCIILSILSTVFVGGLAALGQDTHALTIAFGVLGCFAIGWIDNIAFPGITLVMEPQDIGLATGVMGSIRALGGAVSQAIYVSILINKSGEYIPSYVTSAATSAGLPAHSIPALLAGVSTGNFTAVPDVTPAVLEATGKAITEACFVPNMEGLLGDNVAKRLQRMGSLDGEAKVRKEGV
ncbi:fungal trichothecene efflux pump [Patellaria atrata CBS 101060]|uniref:Fungal trichothecene efflux pump n=1 Tax=Patellaria atrata CBS 101060 TaxID=1346257 RepID=A0A9P4S505_9PEZI|nr:fungal trichothecene efflux pump [Patellaria atrata CBS 101060]